MHTTDRYGAAEPRFNANTSCGFGDFDFLVGLWKVHHRQRKRILSHCTGWDAYLGRTETRKILGGFGVMDENVLFEPRGTYRAMSLRTFDIAANVWSIWWYDGRVPAQLEDPLQGRFDGDVGVFIGDCAIDDAPTTVRHLWTAHEDSPRFERAFSMNNGQTWETNWIMEFHRSG